MLSNDEIDPLLDATVDATEEAIINAMVAARTMIGINGNTIPRFRTIKCATFSASTAGSMTTPEDRMTRFALALRLAVALSIAQPHAQNRPIRGFPDDAVAAQRQREEQFRKIPDAARLKEYMEAMAGEPHVAGQPSSKKVADYALAKFKSFGLDAKLEEFEAMMPWPIETTVEVVAPEKYVLRVKEPVLPEDPDSGDQTPLYNAYSGDGNVTGEVVYVNYGMPADYERLKELGVDVKGKIVIARYGAGWRGIKPKVAYEHGAIGCLIYSDPQRRWVLRRATCIPAGPYRPEFGAQRGSVMDMPVRAGDPLTPGWGSEAGGKKIRIEDARDDPEDSGAADLVRRRRADPAAAQRQGRAERMEGRAAVHVSRRPGPGAGAHEPALRVEEPPALQRGRPHSGRDAAGRVDHLRQPPRCVGERRRRSDQRRGRR